MDIAEFVPIRSNFLNEATHKKLFKFIKNDCEFYPQSITDRGHTQFEKKFSVDEKIRKVSGLFINNVPLPGEPESKYPMTTAFWYNYLVQRFASFFIEHCQENSINIKPVDSNMDVVILKYEDNGHYLPHIDYGKFTPRQVSFSYILNDDYEGGEMEFHFPRNRVAKIPPTKNSCIMFPSNYMFPHKVNPVTKGTRYVVVGWMP